MRRLRDDPMRRQTDRDGERGREGERGRVVEDQLPSTLKGEARPRGEGDDDGPVEVAYAREG